MPNYKYVCERCNDEKIHFLPISSDASIKFDCRFCASAPPFPTETMSRRIIKSQFPEKVGREWAGDWFKKTYGHDIGERDRAFASEQAELDKQVKKHISGE